MRAPGELVGTAIDAMGESDCEALGTGFLVQPINAMSSLAYVAVGMIIAAIALRRLDDVADSLVYAFCVAAIGVGSVLYHGPQPPGSEALHDLPILVAVIFIVVHDAAVVTERPNRRWWVFAVGSTAALLLAMLAPGLLPGAIGVGVVGVVGLEIVVDRRHLRPTPSATRHRIHRSMAGVGVAAAAAWLIGHTESPLCDPDGLVHFHGVWHVVSSLLFGIWWWLAVLAPSSLDGAATEPVAAAPRGTK